LFIVITTPCAKGQDEHQCSAAWGELHGLLVDGRKDSNMAGVYIIARWVKSSVNRYSSRLEAGAATIE
jgi:hypothetical protein